MGGVSNRLAFLAYFQLGCGTLFPWSALITAADFWESQFPGKHMDRLLTVAYLPINLAVLATLMRYGKGLSFHSRVVGGFLGHASIMLAVPLMVQFVPPSHAALVATLALVAGAGACDAAVQGALYGEAAGLHPTLFPRALTSGASLAGLLVAMLRIATKATLPDTHEGLKASAIFYFLIAAAVCLAAAAVYALGLPRLSSIRHYRAAALDAALAGGVDFVPGDDGRLHAEGGGAQAHRAPAALTDAFLSPDGKRSRAAAGYMELSRTPPRTPPPSSPTGAEVAARLAAGGAHHRHPRALEAAEGLIPAGLPASPRAPPRLAGAPPPPHRPPTYGSVLNKKWKVAATLVFTFAVTLTIFPGVLAEDEHSKRLGDWYPVVLIAAFALAETIGKNAPALRLLRLQWPSALLAAAVARAAFVPAFRLAAEHAEGPAVVGGLTFALGATNGWLTSCAMMAAPAGMHGVAAGMAGTIAIFALVLGLNCGALLSFAWLL